MIFDSIRAWQGTNGYNIIEDKLMDGVDAAMQIFFIKRNLHCAEPLQILRPDYARARIHLNTESRGVSNWIEKEKS